MAESKAIYPDTHSYFIKPSFYESEVGALIKELLEINELLDFMGARPPIYEELCREIYLVGRRNKENNSITATIDNVEITITQEMVSEVYGIPNKSDAVKNIWVRLAGRNQGRS